MREKLLRIYDYLYGAYGAQGWWPFLSVAREGGVNPTKSGCVSGYSPLDYSRPGTREEVFEVIVGVLLTQNTSWVNVEKSLLNLNREGLLLPERLVEVDVLRLGELIRPSGYYNQKAERLVLLASWFLELGDRVPSREELLRLKGIGPESADSILLYGFGVSEFVVDSYTKRILVNLGLIEEGAGYDEIKRMFEENLDRDYKMFREFHALLVEHAKRYYVGRGCLRDPLLDVVMGQK